MFLFLLFSLQANCRINISKILEFSTQVSLKTTSTLKEITKTIHKTLKTLNFIYKTDPSRIKWERRKYLVLPVIMELYRNANASPQTMLSDIIKLNKSDEAETIVVLKYLLERELNTMNILQARGRDSMDYIFSFLGGVLNKNNKHETDVYYRIIIKIKRIVDKYLNENRNASKLLSMNSLGRHNLKISKVDIVKALPIQREIGNIIIKSAKNNLEKFDHADYKLLKLELTVDDNIKSVYLLMGGAWIKRKKGTYLMISLEHLNRIIDVIASTPIEIIKKTNIEYLVVSPFLEPSDDLMGYALKNDGLVHLFKEDVAIQETGNGKPIITNWNNLFTHELAHLLIDINYVAWWNAMKKDRLSPTLYSYLQCELVDQIREDIAEFVTIYRNSLGGVLDFEILEKYPNRIKLADELFGISSSLREELIFKLKNLIYNMLLRK